jgi:hypothetical protein
MSPKTIAASALGTNQYRPPPARAKRVAPAITRHPQLTAAGKTRLRRSLRPGIDQDLNGPDDDTGQDQFGRDGGTALPGDHQEEPGDQRRGEKDQRLSGPWRKVREGKDPLQVDGHGHEQQSGEGRCCRRHRHGEACPAARGIGRCHEDDGDAAGTARAARKIRFMPAHVNGVS